MVLALFLYPFQLSGAVLNLGTFGQTYPVIEKDSLQELQERAGAINWEEVLKEKATASVKSYRPKGIPFLPRTLKEETVLVDMTWTLEFDVLDAEGGVLYPKGYSFNPLDYVNFPGTWVVINAEDKDQVKWFQISKYAKDITVQLLITDGRYYELSQLLGRPVFYAFPWIIERLNLTAVPSIARQKGNMMEVKKIAISP